MRIFVTNDDGIESVGLHLLARELTKVGDVTICAPDREYSGSSVAIGNIHSLRPTLRRHQIEGLDNAWSIDGPPALCVMLALGDMFRQKFDLVVSGINPGANTGRNVYHSGTVGAVIVGRSYGVSGIAISQASPTVSRLGQTPASDIAQQLWTSAAKVAGATVASILDDMPSRPTAVNVNVPNRPLDQIAGVRHTRIARESHRDGTRVVLEPHDDSSNSFGVTFEWGSHLEMPIETDVGAVMAGYVSVSSVGYICAAELDPSAAIEFELSNRLAEQVRLN